MFKSLVQFFARFPNFEAFYVLVPSTFHLEVNDLPPLLDLWRSRCLQLGRIIFRCFPLIDNQFQETKIGYLHDGSGWVRHDTRVAIDDEGDIYGGGMSVESAATAMTRLLLERATS
jgi:hypothetical protein